MLNSDALTKKYFDQFVIVDTRRPALDVLKEMVHTEEKSLNLLDPKQIELLKSIVYNSTFFKLDTPIHLHLLEIKQDERSRLYYQSTIEENNMILTYFGKKIIVAIIDETAGLLYTNCPLLANELNIRRGISLTNIKKKDLYFFEYLSFFQQNERQ